MNTGVAFVRNGRLDVLAINPLGRAFYTPVLGAPAQPANLARYCFLDPGAEDFYPDWEEAADTTVAILRTEAGRDPYNRALTDLVGELATRSDAFGTRWARYSPAAYRYSADLLLEYADTDTVVPATQGSALAGRATEVTIPAGSRKWIHSDVSGAALRAARHRERALLR